jgi:hypothetical protein
VFDKFLGEDYELRLAAVKFHAIWVIFNLIHWFEIGKSKLHINFNIFIQFQPYDWNQTSETQLLHQISLWRLLLLHTYNKYSQW